MQRTVSIANHFQIIYIYKTDDNTNLIKILPIVHDQILTHISYLGVTGILEWYSMAHTNVLLERAYT